MMKIGFIGTGHMGASLVLAMKDGKDTHFYLNNRTKEKAQKLVDEIPNSQLASIEEIAMLCDFVFLGVKPIDMKGLLSRLSRIKSKAVYVSMAAGIDIADIKRTLPNPIIRIMPNTPVLVHSGTTLVSYSADVSDTIKKVFSLIMEPTGRLIDVFEYQINPMSVLTGSAPAYIDYFMDALIQAAMKEGLNEEAATGLCLSMVEGAVKLSQATNKAPVKLGQEVCSPGGSTIEGVNVLLEGGLYELVQKAYQATLDKNRRMLS